MTTTVLLTLKLKPDSAEPVSRIFAENLADTRAFEGCEAIEVVLNQDDPTDMVLIERWQTRGHYEKYLAWRTESGFLDILGPLVAGPPDIRYFDTVDA